MAKGVNKIINVYVNGKEVENSVKSIEAAMAKLRSEMNNAEIGSAKYVAAAMKIKTLRGILADHNKELEQTGTIWKKTIDDFGKFTIAFFGLGRLYGKVTGWMRCELLSKICIFDIVNSFLKKNCNFFSATHNIAPNFIKKHIIIAPNN